MYLSYFDKFLGLEPYLEIDEKEWEYIKRHSIKRMLKKVFKSLANMTYEIPYLEISEKDF